MTVEQLARFAAAWRAGDVETILRHMAHNATYSASLGPEPGRTFTGRDELEAGVPELLAAHAELDFHPGSAWIAGSRGVAYWHYTRRDDPRGTVVARGVDLLAFQDGLIVSKDAYRKATRG